MAKVNEDLLSPTYAQASAKGPGVKRVNNGPIWLVAGIALVFVLVIALGANDRAEQQKQMEPTGQAAKATRSSKGFAKELTAGIDKPFIPADTPPAEPAPPAPTPPAEASVKVVLPDDLSAPPVPDHKNSSFTDEHRERVLTEKMQQFAEALQAKTGVPAESLESAKEDRRQEEENGARSLSAARANLEAQRDQLKRVMANRADPTSSYMAKMAAARRAAVSGGIASNEFDDGDSPFAQAAAKPTYAQFDRDEEEPDRWALNSRIQAPRTPYELRAGFVIPATMISGINSDLPGQITAQVNQAVFDTATQRQMLIPQGARLVGTYASDVAYGQRRLLVAWQRIVFPDGKALDIGSMAGADPAGYSGFKDQVNNHLMRLFGSAFLMSGITAGITLSQDRSSSGQNNRVDASSAMSESLGQQLGQVTAQLIAKNINVAPTLEIRPGYRFNVVVTKDITLTSPYKPFDY